MSFRILRLLEEIKAGSSGANTPTQLPDIQDTANSIYEYLPLLLSSDAFNSQIATVQTDYQGLATGLSTQSTTIETKLDAVTVQVTNVESNLIPTLATLSYQDILHQAEAALLATLQGSVDSVINTELPSFESRQVIVIGGVQSAVDAIALTQLPSIESSLTTEITALGTGIATDLFALLQILNALTITASNLPTQTYDIQLSNLQATVDATELITSSIPTDRYHDRFNSVQAQLDGIAANQGQSSNISVPSYDVQLDRIEDNQSAQGDKLNSIQSKVNQLPTFNPQSDLADVNTKLDNQAILIGGRASSTQANSIKSDTQFIKDAIPTLATGNQSGTINNNLVTLNSAVGAIPRNIYNDQFSRLETIALAGRNEGNGISRNTYNAQLNLIQAHANGANVAAANAGVQGANAARQATAANVGVQSALTKLDQLLAGSSGSSSVYGDELIGLLGYTNQENTKFSVTASSILIGTPSLLTNKSDQDFLTQNAANSWIRIDFGTNNASRRITLTGLGLRSRVDNAAHPLNLVIEGSLDNSTWTTIYTWQNIGFTAPYQWRLSPAIGNVTPYRYIRIRQPGTNVGGQNYLGISEINCYGSLNVL
jgi:hypothetical protein